MKPQRPRRLLFVATILTGSFLLFMVQPMVARMALPRLGGAPNVWNSAMLVYQALLLAGYFYAHRLSRLPMQWQSRIHLGLLVAAALTLPVGLIDLPAPAAGFEVLWVPALLALSIGPVFLLVSAQAPLMQRWFSVHPDAGEPWALYAASNVGSFAGLIAYPLVAEPLLSLRAQAWLWSAGYAGLIVLIALAARARLGLDQDAEAMCAPSSPPVPRRQVLLWMVLAAVPSGLMLSTTTHLTTDLIAMPLLWVIPLGLYLFSFVVAFAGWRAPVRMVSSLAWAVILSVGGMAMISHGSTGLVPVMGSLLLLFVVCTALHGRLYDLRPAPDRLTWFYLIMSLGGVIGGAFTGLIAPLLFDWVWEHPLLVLAAVALLPVPNMLDWRRMKGIEPQMVRLGQGVLVVITALLIWQLYVLNLYVNADETRELYAAAAAFMALGLIAWRWIVTPMLLAIMLAQGGFATLADSRNGVRTRSYFGIYTVRDYPAEKYRTLAHGTTLHGEQFTDIARRRLPLSYYGPGSGVAIAFANAPRLIGDHARMAVVGLGAGTLTCFARPGQSWQVFEIDQAVVDFSRRGTFTFVSDCAPQTRIVVGDARLTLSKASRGSIDMLALDAFSSDAIPLHLMTHEAFGIYLDALSARGVLMVHISNRFIDLEPVVAAEIRQRGLHAILRDDNPPADMELTPSTWIAISRDPAQIAILAHAAPGVPWRALKPPAPQGWTDNYASILPYIEWRNFMGSEP